MTLHDPHHPNLCGRDLTEERRASLFPLVAAGPPVISHAPQERVESDAHLFDDRMHLREALVLGTQLAIDPGDLLPERRERIAALGRGQFGPDPVLPAPELLDVTHQAVRRPQLRLHLSQQIELARDEMLGVILQTPNGGLGGPLFGSIPRSHASVPSSDRARRGERRGLRGHVNHSPPISQL
jgi:hypothetical protein